MSAAFLFALAALALTTSATGFSETASRSDSRRPKLPNVVVSASVLSLETPDMNSTVDHQYWFQRLFRTRLSREEAACARNGSVFHAESRACHYLFAQGPCRATEWLVMEGAGDGRGLKVRCSRRPCAPGFSFLADGASRLCVEDKEACRDVTDAKLSSVQYSLRGEGRCQCKGFRLRGADGRCHIIFSRGHCPQGQMLAPSYSPTLDAMSAVCVPNPCQEGLRYVLMQNDSVYENCVTDIDIRCAVRFTLLFTAEVNLAVPVCGDFQREAIRPPTVSRDCVRGNNGVCQKTVARSALPYDWSVIDDFDDEPEASASTYSSAESRLRRFLTPYALLSLMFV